MNKRYITKKLPQVMKFLESYIMREKLRTYEPYNSRAEHDFYKKLSAYEANEKKIILDIYDLLSIIRSIGRERATVINNYFMDQMKRRRASDKERENV